VLGGARARRWWWRACSPGAQACCAACTCCRLWALAWPLSWMEVLTFTKELVITGFVGHLGALELSALVLAQTLYNVTGNAP